jgi:hypothetical protein
VQRRIDGEYKVVRCFAGKKNRLEVGIFGLQKPLSCILMGCFREIFRDGRAKGVIASTLIGLIHVHHSRSG